MLERNSVQFLKIFLWLVAIHSFLVGLFLILLPESWLDFFGYYNYRRTFFQVQGGVFHLVMAFGYWLTARDPVRERALMYLIIFAKGLATVFLSLYYFYVERIWIVLISAAGDACMGIIILIAFIRIKKSVHSGDKPS
jgi:hypothetical protein